MVFRKVDQPGETSAKYSMVSSRLLLDELLEDVGSDADDDAACPCWEEFCSAVGSDVDDDAACPC